MKTLFFLVLLIRAAAVKHSLQYFYTATSGIPHFPDFLTVGIVDGQTISYYDSVIKKEIPKQDWMAKTEAPEYWERQTKISISAEQYYKVSIENVRQRLNQSGDVHIVQRMYGCEWDDETQELNGFNQYGYDGEDFISIDLKEKRWVTPKQQSFITKLKWDHDKVLLETDKEYLTHDCVNWLRTYLKFGKSSLLRTVLPSVSLLQKTPSSPVSCHATGFYPDRADMFWRKDGEKLHEDVDHGEILPNHDGTFQMSVDLNISSFHPQDWSKYECVFQLSGVEKDVVIRLDKAVIKTNEKSMSIIIIIIAVVVLVVLIGLICGIIVYRKKNVKRPPSPVSNSDVMEELNPKA